jgi:uncharacterized Zn-binding protein involved in type VI secretion
MMPGFLLQVGATVLCTHGGQAQPTAPNPRVKLSGQPAITQTCVYSIAGCPFNVSGSPVPCVTGQWISAAARVQAGGAPVILLDSQSVCTPNGTPMNIVLTQTRVRGS